MWSAHTDQPLHRNQSVRVTRRDGLTLWVTPKGKREDSS
ncbi:MAG TPA: NfeD family protein [Gammaproteobacteria bacterium]|nr:NfeD family protein [Gammaproteobacteria bacterium]